MKPNPSAEKRRKERARQEKKQAKAERREQRRAEKDARPEPAPGVDPELEVVDGPLGMPPAQRQNAVNEEGPTAADPEGDTADRESTAN